VSLATAELERELKALQLLARRLMPPLNRKPHIFHETKAELIEGIGRLLDRLRGVAAPDRTFRAAQRDEGHSLLRMKGRTIPVERRRS
jgi:hypothetical protein